MSKAFYFNMKYCTGCRACQIACKDRNNLPVGVLYRQIESREVGTFPNPSAYHYSKTCHHCDSPACVAVCPTGALVKTDDGTVQQDQEKCIGCQSCVNNCPYEAPQYLPELGVSGKCDSCYSIRGEDGLPQCVAACVMRALDFGERDELLSRHPDAISILDLPMIEDAGTAPTTLVDAREAAFEENAIKVVY